MSLKTVCDAWMADLLTVAGLTTVPVKCQHTLASWSPELLHAQNDERHIAVFPNREVETPVRETTQPSDTITTLNTILIWEEAASDATGLIDDDVANAAWIALYEAVLARLYVWANVSGATALGGAGLLHHFRESRMDLAGTVRFIEIVFTTERQVAFT